MAINPTPFSPKTRNRFLPLIVMMSVAVFLGLTAAVGIWQYLGKTQQKVKELTVTRKVVVAAKQILAGTKLTDADITIKEFPAQAIPKEYPSSIASIRGRVVKTTIQPDEIITETRLVGVGAAGGLPGIIPAGQRAITIKVNDVIGVGGFIAPGDKVDVITVMKQSAEQTFSKIILQDVLVIAVGDKMYDPNIVPEGQAKVVAQVTVALNPRDSEILALATEVGKLQLVLRPHSENVLSPTAGATLEDVFGYLVSNDLQASAPSPLTPAGAASPISSTQSKKSIEFILGNRRTFRYY